jgi:hypothetical protein
MEFWTNLRTKKQDVRLCSCILLAQNKYQWQAVTYTVSEHSSFKKYGEFVIRLID